MRTDIALWPVWYSKRKDIRSNKNSHNTPQAAGHIYGCNPWWPPARGRGWYDKIFLSSYSDWETFEGTGEASDHIQLDTWQTKEDSGLWTATKKHCFAFLFHTHFLAEYDDFITTPKPLENQEPWFPVTNGESLKLNEHSNRTSNHTHISTKRVMFIYFLYIWEVELIQLNK